MGGSNAHWHAVMITFLIALLLHPLPTSSTHHRLTQQPDHAQLFIDAAFAHAPFDGTSYGYRTKKNRYQIPDLDGNNQGEQTWVDVGTF